MTVFGPRTEKLQAQLDSFPALPRGWVLTIAAALIAGGVYFVSTASSRPTSVPLFGGGELRDFDLDQVEMAFGAAGLKGWRRENQQIYVPSATRHEYLAALQSSSALPYSLHSAVGEAFESGGYFESDSVRRMRTQYAKSQDLGNKLTAFADVQWASVDYDEQDAGGFGQNLIRSASVVVVPVGDKPLPATRVRMIQELVAGAYAGMSSDEVVVTDTKARESVSGADPEALRRFHAELELEEKITRLLAAYGKTHVAVKLDENDQPRISIGVSEDHLRSQWRSRFLATNETTSVPEPKQADWDELLELASENVRSAVMPLLSGDESVNDSISLWSFPTTTVSAGGVQFAASKPASVNWLDELLANPTATLGIGSLLAVAFGIAWFSMRMRLRRQASEASLLSMHTATTEMQPPEDGALREDLAELVGVQSGVGRPNHSWLDGGCRLADDTNRKLRITSEIDCEWTSAANEARRASQIQHSIRPHN